MKFDVLTLFPETVIGACNFSIIKRALEKKIIQINTINPRDYTEDKHRKVDDTIYGGGAGMLLSCQPYLDALKSVKKINNSQTIILSPQGEKYNQRIAKELSQKSQIILICGHYEGFDERIKLKTKAREISIGDFVLTGGEYPALCIIDSVTRLIDGVLGDISSAVHDSHSEILLDYPQYTKPRVYKRLKVPEILLNGNHAEIDEWRRLQQFLVTKNKRPDLFEKFINQKLSEYDKNIMEKYKKLF